MLIGLSSIRRADAIEIQVGEVEARNLLLAQPPCLSPGRRQRYTDW
jgi:hypothetical protein